MNGNCAPETKSPGINFDYGDINSSTSPFKTNGTGCISSNELFNAHRVRSDHYIMYILEGSLGVVAGYKNYVAVPGDMVFYRSGERQQYSHTEQNNLKYYWIHFTGYCSGQILARCGFSESGVYRVGLSEKVMQCFSNYFADFYGQPVDGSYMEVSAAAHLMEILAAMRDAMELKNDKPDRTEQKIYASARYIVENYSLPLTVKQLAEQQKMCSGYYSKLFTKYIGTSPQNYIINTRLQNAGMLLLERDITVAKAAFAVGYDDSMYFSRIFRKKFGVSPEEYRRIHHEEEPPR